MTIEERLHAIQEQLNQMPGQSTMSVVVTHMAAVLDELATRVRNLEAGQDVINRLVDKERGDG